MLKSDFDLYFEEEVAVAVCACPTLDDIKLGLF